MDGIAEVLAETIIAAKRNNPIYDTDYTGDDGLIYCGNCNTPKQCRINLFGEEMTVSALCQCQAEADRLKKQQLKEQQHRERIARMRLDCFPKYSRYDEMTFAGSDMTEELQKAKKYCDKFSEFKDKGKGLLLYGPCGTGKTHIAACIANELIDQGVPVLFTTMAKIVNRLQSSFDGRRELFDELRQVPLLIIDDFRAERSTEFMQETTYEVINGRTESGLPLMVTTNLTNADFKQAHDIQTERIISRILDITIPLEIKGADKRRERVKSEYAEDKLMLD